MSADKAQEIINRAMGGFYENDRRHF